MARAIMERVPLKHPVTPKQGEAISAVDVLRPNGRDLRELDNLDGHVAMVANMIERLCRYPNGDPVFSGFADELDVEDFGTLGESVMSLINAALPTGESA